MDGMRILQKRLQAMALPVLLGAVAMCAHNWTAAAVFALPQHPAPTIGLVLTGKASPVLTPVQQLATNSVVPTNLSSGQLVFTNGGTNFSVGIFTVPSGKRLDIEFVSAIALLQPSQLLLTVSIDGLQVLPQFNGTQIDGSPVYVVSQPLRDVLLAGQTLVVAAGRTGNSGVGVIAVNVIGELEDAP